MVNHKDIAGDIFSAAIGAVNPHHIVREFSDEIRSAVINKKVRRCLVAGFGKSSCQMGKAFEELFDADLITDGIIITKYGHAVSRPLNFSSSQLQNSSLRIYEAGHPIPDENGFRATGGIIELLKDADEETLVVCLISGGGSALLVSPYKGITLKEKQTMTGMLLKAGADITEVNTVRKHISRVKGGRLAEIAYPARIVTLILSDVIGDKLDVIASGPTAPDTSTFGDAMEVIRKFRLDEKIPANVLNILKKGVAGDIPDTPKPGNPIFKNVQNIIIGNNLKAVNAAADRARLSGFHAEIIASDISGEARDVGRWLAKKAVESKGTKAKRHKGMMCLISGGETTVTVRGKGKGGRNTELALSFAMEMDGIEGITFLSAGTDGTDGPTDAAGAIVDGKTMDMAKSLGLNPQEYLDNNDSYNFFKQIDSLLITGPTGTNVMDLQIILIE